MFDSQTVCSNLFLHRKELEMHCAAAILLPFIEVTCLLASKFLPVIIYEAIQLSKQYFAFQTSFPEYLKNQIYFEKFSSLFKQIFLHLWFSVRPSCFAPILFQYARWLWSHIFGSLVLGFPSHMIYLGCFKVFQRASLSRPGTPSLFLALEITPTTPSLPPLLSSFSSLLPTVLFAN